MEDRFAEMVSLGGRKPIILQVPPLQMSNSAPVGCTMTDSPLLVQSHSYNSPKKPAQSYKSPKTRSTPDTALRSGQSLRGGGLSFKTAILHPEP